MNTIKQSLLMRTIAGLIVITAWCVWSNSPVQATTTHGSGGTYSWQTKQSFSNNKNSSRYHIDASGIDSTKPIGLAVSFHGDGAYEYYHPESSYALGGKDGIRAVAREKNMITVSILTPDRTTGDRTWWHRGKDYATYTHDLIEKIYSLYNINRSNVWLIGYSGGAEFLSQYYLPMYAGSGQIEAGGVLFFGGGDSPLSAGPQPTKINPIPASMKKNLRMWWGAGQKDLPSDADPGWIGGYAAAKNSHAWYKKQGFTDIHTYYPKGWCHATTPTCPSFESKFGSYFREQLNKKSPEDKPDDANTFSYTYTTSANGVTFKALAPGSKRVQVTVSKYPFHDARSQRDYYYDYNYTKKDGSVTLSLENELRWNTKYYYKLLLDGVVVEDTEHFTTSLPKLTHY